MYSLSDDNYFTQLTRWLALYHIHNHVVLCSEVQIYSSLEIVITCYDTQLTQNNMCNPCMKHAVMLDTPSSVWAKVRDSRTWPLKSRTVTILRREIPTLSSGIIFSILMCSGGCQNHGPFWAVHHENKNSCKKRRKNYDLMKLMLGLDVNATILKRMTSEPLESFFSHTCALVCYNDTSSLAGHTHE